MTFFSRLPYNFHIFADPLWKCGPGRLSPSAPTQYPTE